MWTHPVDHCSLLFLSLSQMISQPPVGNNCCWNLCTVCHSSISNTSADHNLLVPNGSYALTAGDCMRCSCSANNYEQLDCSPVQRRGCPAVLPCDGGLKLGQTTNGNGCESKICAYSGYSNTTSLRIHTALVTANQTACDQKGGAARTVFAGSMWRMSVISFHMVLILICFL